MTDGVAQGVWFEQIADDGFGGRSGNQVLDAGEITAAAGEEAQSAPRAASSRAT